MAKKIKTTALLIDFSFSEANKSDYALLLDYTSLSFIDYENETVRLRMEDVEQLNKLTSDLKSIANIDVCNSWATLVSFKIKASVKYNIGGNVLINVK